MKALKPRHNQMFRCATWFIFERELPFLLICIWGRLDKLHILKLNLNLALQVTGFDDYFHQKFATNMSGDLQALLAAAEGGDAGAAFDVGCRFSEGREGVEKDVCKAAKYFKLAADQGDARGQNS